MPKCEECERIAAIKKHLLEATSITGAYPSGVMAALQARIWPAYRAAERAGHEHQKAKHPA